MSVYVDPPGSAPGQLGRVVFVCHMFADSIPELVGFAKGIGLKESWLQGNDPDGRRIPHFDLTAGKRAQAVANGAIEICRERAVEIIKQWRRRWAEFTLGGTD